MLSTSVSLESVTKQEVMVSSDVQSLFTNVSTDKASEVINRRLIEDRTLEIRTTLTPGQVTMFLEIIMSKDYAFHVATINSSASKQKEQTWTS